MPDSPSDVEQLERDIPGFERQYNANFKRLGERRVNQGIKPNLQHLHLESVDATKKDIDLMTELLKPEALMESLKEADEEISKSGEQAYLGFIDVNKMRNLNNTEWGHRGGDLALKTIGQTLKKTLRMSDIAGRYGGDELVILLRSVTPEQAKKIIEERFFPNLIKGVTVSVGLTPFQPGRLESTLKEADSIMYEIKEKAHKTGNNELGFVNQEQEELEQAA